VAGSAVGLYFYLRAMIQLYLRPAPVVASAAPVVPSPTASSATAPALFPGLRWAQDAGGSMVIVLLLLMLALGFYPSPFIKLARAAGVEPQALATPLTADPRAE
jgi:NADH-quinone oxidoreductase subunit N